MQLHLFNPENDLALASNHHDFVATHRIRQMANDLSFLPAWWAQADEALWVNDPTTAEEFAAQWSNRFSGLQFYTDSDVHRATTLYPWGWNAHLVRKLIKLGMPLSVLPTTESIARTHELSSRLTAAQVLNSFKATYTSIGDFPLCGEVEVCYSEPEIASAIGRFPRTLLKAPWSSSGKGLRQGFGRYEIPLSGWCSTILATQGYVMVEPLYTRLKDFAMLFEVTESGDVNYLGLSLFTTTLRGSYIGNVVAKECEKMAKLAKFLPLNTQQVVIELLTKLLKEKLSGRYCGYLGVDMMICQSANEICLHPCVEINLRRTMGHVALHLSPLLANGKEGFFSIVYTKTPIGLSQEQLFDTRHTISHNGQLNQGFIWLTPILHSTQFAAKLEVVELNK